MTKEEQNLAFNAGLTAALEIVAAARNGEHDGDWRSIIFSIERLWKRDNKSVTL